MLTLRVYYEPFRANQSQTGENCYSSPVNMQFVFFLKILQNRMLAPPGRLAPPPRGNPGSDTGGGGTYI